MKNKLARLSLIFNFTFFILHSPAALAGYLQHVAVDMSDSRQNYPLRVARGEVVDLSVDFFDEGDPIDFEAGASATLHTRTNSMDAAYSWRTSGSVSSNAALFVLDVDAVLPAASGEWTVVVEGGGRVLARAGGQAYVRGGAAASIAADPLPALSGYATTGYVARAAAEAAAVADPRHGVADGDTVFVYADGSRSVTNISTVTSANILGPLVAVHGGTNLASVAAHAFSGTLTLARVDLPAVTSIGTMAFHNDSRLVRIDIPELGTASGMSFFAGTSPEELDFPLLSSASGAYAFGGMSKLRRLRLPSFAGTLGMSCFAGDSSLEVIDFGDAARAVPTLTDATSGFNGVPTNCVVVVPDSMAASWRAASRWNTLASKGIRILSQGEYRQVRNHELGAAVSAAAKAATNYTDAAVAGIPAPDLSFTNDFLKAESDPVWSEWVAARTNNAGKLYADMAGYALTAGDAETLGGIHPESFAMSFDVIETANSAASAVAQSATNYTDVAVAALDFASPTDVATEVTAASNALARAWSADSVLLSSMLLGSNVVAEVTNYNSQVRSPMLRILQLNESNEYFQVWAETNNLSRVALAATNHADAVSAAAYVAATNYAAPRAWSGTTSGLGADAPEGWTWISTPNLAIGGGLEFEKHVTGGGEIWVLKNNGMVAQFNALTNNAAYLEIASLDGESVFRIEKTDSVLLGVDTTSVSVDGNTLVCGVAAVSAEHPLARVRASLTQGDWTREEDGTQSGSATILPGLATVEWSGQSGAWVCRITNDTGGHSLFATMQYLQEGGTKIVPAAPMDGSAGILCTDGVHKVRPVYNNGSITWEVFQ